MGSLITHFFFRTTGSFLCLWLSGRANDAMQELDVPSTEQSGLMTNILNQIKCQFLAHSQYLNFFTVLALASVPNPLFDLTRIMCRQLGIPFWKFFLATLIGKATIKILIQMIVIISICNNHFLDWMENKLIWALGFIPDLDPILPDSIAKVHGIREEDKKWGVSLGAIQNTVILLILINFATIVAKSYLKKQQEKELDSLNKCNCSQQDMPPAS